MNKPHKHAELMMEYAKDALETDEPWERWEIQHISGFWMACTSDIGWSNNVKYRRKPRTILINGFEVPEPYRGEMKPHQEYYFPDLSEQESVLKTWWSNDEYDQTRMKVGLIHINPEAAQLHAEALLSFTKQESKP